MVIGEHVGRGAFWQGLALGLALIACLVALGGGYLARRGAVIVVDRTVLAERVRAEVRQAVLRELPLAMAQWQEGVPGQVAAEAGRQLAATRLDLGGFVVAVPPVAIQQVERALDAALRTGLAAAGERVDLEALAGQLGDWAAQLAAEQLEAALAGQLIAVEIAPGIRLPIHFQFR